MYNGVFNTYENHPSSQYLQAPTNPKAMSFFEQAYQGKSRLHKKEESVRSHKMKAFAPPGKRRDRFNEVLDYNEGAGIHKSRPLSS